MFYDYFQAPDKISWNTYKRIRVTLYVKMKLIVILNAKTAKNATSVDIANLATNQTLVVSVYAKTFVVSVSQK